MKAPTIEQWNLAAEQQLPHGTLLHVGYEGEEAYHLSGSVEGNPGIYNPNETLAQNAANINIRRPMGAYYQGLALGEDVGTSSFNALVASLQKQTTHGLTFLVGYRWSKCLNESEEAFFDRDAYSSTDPRFDRGPCSYNVTNQLKASFVWEIPSTHFGLAAANKVLDGWQANGILTLRSGQPFSVLSGVNNSTSGIGLDRADKIANPDLSRGRSNAQKAHEFFNTQAFTANAPGTFGNSGRDSVAGPGYSDFDFSLARTFKLPVGESQALQFRAESFNLLNRVNFMAPNSTVASSSYGTISSANDPRILQFALKYRF
jgi:hypothetical protein